MKQAMLLLVVGLVALGFCAADAFAHIRRQDPTLGCLTATESQALFVTWSALPDQAQKIVAGINDARARLRRNDIAGAKAALAALEGFSIGHAQALPAWKAQLDVAVLTDPVPPEPPIEPEPEPEPPDEIPPPSGSYGAALPEPHEVWSIEFGGTPGDKAMHAWADNGGVIDGVELVAGQGSGVSNFNEGTVATIEASNCALRAHATGTKWLSRTKNRAERWERSTFTSAGAPYSTEGHLRYGNPTDFFDSFDCLSVESYGNPIQLAYRPGAEAGGPVRNVRIRDRIENCHKPVDAAGHNSDRAGPLVALYGLGPECDHSIDLQVLQDLWAQVGPIVTCVPEGAKDPATGDYLPPWWTPDMWTDDELAVTVQADILPPKAQELFRVAGVRTVELRGKIRLRAPGAPRVLIDQTDPQTGQLLYRVKPAERVVVDLEVRGADGAVISCPIEWKGAVRGTTAGGELVLQN